MQTLVSSFQNVTYSDCSIKSISVKNLLYSKTKRHVVINNWNLLNIFYTDGATNSLTTNRSNNMFNKHEEENTFDLLLKEAQAKLRKRKVWHTYCVLVINIINII